MEPTARARLAEAMAAEKQARRLRRERKDAGAIEAYGRARDLYVDSGLAFHECGESVLAVARGLAFHACEESVLADEVRRAIARCRQIESNIRHPKKRRENATTPRPNCCGCDKPLRRYKKDGRTFDNGVPREWGDYGDNRFCGLTCGWRWACRHADMPRDCKIPKEKK